MTKNSKWQEWILSQEPELQKEILRGKVPTAYFSDAGDIDGISIEELEILDSKYNL